MLSFFVLVVVLLFVPVNTFFHEGSHWVFSTVSPFTEPVGFHVLDMESFERGCAGYVGVIYSYLYAQDVEPVFFDVLDEALAMFVGGMAHLICAFMVCWNLLVTRNVLRLDELWGVYAQTNF